MRDMVLRIKNSNKIILIKNDAIKNHRSESF